MTRNRGIDKKSNLNAALFKLVTTIKATQFSKTNSFIASPHPPLTSHSPSHPPHTPRGLYRYLNNDWLRYCKTMQLFLSSYVKICFG